MAAADHDNAKFLKMLSRVPWCQVLDEVRIEYKFKIAVQSNIILFIGRF